MFSRITFHNIIRFLFITFFKLTSFCIGLGVFLFILVSTLQKHGHFTQNYFPLLICIIVSVSFYLIAKLLEEFYLEYDGNKKLCPSFTRSIILNPIKSVILIGSIIWLSYIQYYNFTAYCFEKHRYLNKEELINNVIENNFVISNENIRKDKLNKICINYGLEDENYTKKFPIRKCGNISYESRKEFIKKTKFREYKECNADRDELFQKSQLEKCSDNRIYYESVEEFKRKNPNCCKLTKHPWFNNNLDNFINNFLGRYLYGLEIVAYSFPFADEKYYQYSYFVNSCGKAVMNHGWSMDNTNSHL